MGNCFGYMEEKYSFLENPDEIMHKIDTNKESIETINTVMNSRHSIHNENFKSIHKDIKKINTIINKIYENQSEDKLENSRLFLSLNDPDETFSNSK